MIVLWVALPFNVPVFNGSDDVTFVCRTELNFDFISTLCIRVLHEKIEPSRSRLAPLPIAQHKISEAKDGGIIG
jgi:hypothetical protein